MPYEATKVTVEVDGRRMKLSSLEKVMYPRTGTTKAQVLDYYARIAPVILPHLRDPRGTRRIRFPHGSVTCSSSRRTSPRHAGVGPSRRGATPSFPLIDDLAGLTYFANLNSLELHVPHGATRGGARRRARRPDRLVIDRPRAAAPGCTMRARRAHRARAAPVASGSTPCP